MQTLVRLYCAAACRVGRRSFHRLASASLSWAARWWTLCSSNLDTFSIVL